LEPDRLVERPTFVARPRLPLALVAAGVFVVACGDDPTESISTVQSVPGNGDPDCGDHEPWVAEPDIDFDAPGSPTAEAVLRPFLEQWQELFGGDVVMVGEDRAALRIEGSEVVVAYTTRTRPGGFGVWGSTGCDGFEPDVLPGPPPGPPRTAPPETPP
jgi:hypothetical protein